MTQSEQLASAIENIKKMLSKHQPVMAIPRSEFIILRVISECENPQIKISDISHKLSISNAAVSQMIASLEDKQLVRRVTTDTDRRIVYIVLTDKGQKILKEASIMLSKFMDIMVANLGNKDSEDLIRILNKLQLLLEEGTICHEINN